MSKCYLISYTNNYFQHMFVILVFDTVDKKVKLVKQVDAHLGLTLKQKVQFSNAKL